MFRNIALVIFLAGILIGGYFRYKAEKSGEPLSWNEEGVFVMVLLRVAGLIGWASIIVYLINPAWMKWSEMPLPDWARWIGVVSGIISVPLMYWLFKSIGTNITQTVKTRKDHQLVRHGPYRWVRHPLYSVGTLFFLSFTLIASNWFILLASLAGLIMLLIRLPREEQNLIDRFGDEYRVYMRETGRLIPRLRRRLTT
ncbi:MAG: isoprenylcysteine carboxylmethyltransferase family protein [Acidobacteriota bacterium]|nr:MAG: isoprenylcysteine carboxylmethyltransferase family protein [Acidobacteriota bacterium]